MQTAKASRKQSSLSGKESAQGCLPKRLLPSVHGISQARILEWVAVPSSRGSSPPRDRTRVSCGSCIADGFFTAELPGKPLCLLETCLEWSQTLKPQTACCSALGGSRQGRLPRERGSGACVGVCWAAGTARSTLFSAFCRNGLQGQEARGAAHPSGAPHGRADPGGRAGGARRGPRLHRPGPGR